MTNDELRQNIEAATTANLIAFSAIAELSGIPRQDLQGVLNAVADSGQFNDLTAKYLDAYIQTLESQADP
jgi:hypothetical protein